MYLVYSSVHKESFPVRENIAYTNQELPGRQVAVYPVGRKLGAGSSYSVGQAGQSKSLQGNHRGTVQLDKTLHYLEI